MFYVLAVWSHTDPLIVELTIDGETIETTLEHPFYTADGTWIAAGDLRPGDELRNAAWHTGTVERVFVTYRPQPMYNFSVAAAHTYFVGDARWLVHNACPRPQIPTNLTTAQFGDLIGWGTGNTGTRDSLLRMEQLTVNDIHSFLDAGVTADMAQKWANWYLDIAGQTSRSGNLNPNAEGRAQLMQYIADWMRELE